MDKPNSLESLKAVAQATEQTHVYRPNQAAERLGVSIQTIYRLVRVGDLKKIRIGARATGIIGVDELLTRRIEEATR